MRRTRERGQAAVEWVGISLVVLLVLAGAGTWLHARLTPSPPPPVQLKSNIPFSFDPYAPQPTPGYVRVLRATGSGLKAGFELAVEADRALQQGFNDELVAQWRAFREDPLAGWNALGDPLDWRPSDPVIEMLRRSRDAWRYYQYLRSMPPRQALMVASYDLGRVSTRKGVEFVQAYARKRLTRAVGERLGQPRPSEPRDERQP
jgi:hypothetical protein